MDVVWGWDNCMCILLGLVRLDFGVGGLDGDSEEVVWYRVAIPFF